jgi:hypothetical protein
VSGGLGFEPTILDHRQHVRDHLAMPPVVHSMSFQGQRVRLSEPKFKVGYGRGECSHCVRTARPPGLSAQVQTEVASLTFRRSHCPASRGLRSFVLGPIALSSVAETQSL